MCDSDDTLNRGIILGTLWPEGQSFGVLMFYWFHLGNLFPVNDDTLIRGTIFGTLQLVV